MKISRAVRTLLGAGIAALASHAAGAAAPDPASSIVTSAADGAQTATPPVLQSPAAAVTELQFSEFYKRPVGAYGLEPSARLLELDGKRVRITGYMVREEAPTPGLFILSPLPVSLSDVEDGPADDLPPAVAFVHLQGDDAKVTVAFQPEPLALVGTLQVGNDVEANDRVSAVRLVLDAPVVRRHSAQASVARGARHN